MANPLESRDRRIRRINRAFKQPSEELIARSMLLDMAVLTDEQVDAALPDLNGWERVDGALRRSIKFPSFLAGIDAVRRVAEHAESKDHHPDIDIRWRTVTFALVTHSEGGITGNDVAMAHDIDKIVGS
jgi:4a-hydroxytetrahydrobiopterin dehydratase